MIFCEMSGIFRKLPEISGVFRKFPEFTKSSRNLPDFFPDFVCMCLFVVSFFKLLAMLVAQHSQLVQTHLVPLLPWKNGSMMELAHPKT